MELKDFIKKTEDEQLSFLLLLEENKKDDFLQKIKKVNGKLFRKMHGKLSSKKQEKSLQKAGLETSNINEIPLKFLSPNPYQPRKTFNEDSLKSLSESIKVNGLISPILVSKINDEQYIIIAGERRYRASKILCNENLSRCTIEAKIIQNASDEKLRILSLLENTDRENLSLRELSLSIKKYNEDGLSIRKIEELTGISKSKVSRLLKIGNLDEWILNKMEDLRITSEYAMDLIANATGDKKLQSQMLRLSSEGATNAKLNQMLKKETKPQASEKIVIQTPYEKIIPTSKIISKTNYNKLDIDKKEKVDKLLDKMVKIQKDMKNILQKDIEDE